MSADMAGAVVALRTNSVYRYYDKAGRLIYVGITAKGPKRQYQHSRKAEWWPHVHHQEIDHCADEGETRQRERELILAHRPPFNQVHNDRYEATRAAYLVVVAAERALADAQAGTPVSVEPCGHCVGCDLAGEPGVDGEAKELCHRLVGREETLADDDLCEKCGSPDCVYADGLGEGRVEGWVEGFDRGLEAGAKEESARNWPAIMANGVLEMVIDRRIDGAPVNLAPKGRDESLTVLAECIDRWGISGAITEAMIASYWPPFQGGHSS